MVIMENRHGYIKERTSLVGNVEQKSNDRSYAGEALTGVPNVKTKLTLKNDS